MKEEEKRKKYFRLDRSCLTDEYTLAVYSASYGRHTPSLFFILLTPAVTNISKFDFIFVALYLSTACTSLDDQPRF